MGGTTRVILFDEKTEPISFLTFTGHENEIFFSKSFVNGDIEKAIKDFIPSEKELDPTLILAPEDYGLTLIDFPEKKLFSLTHYDRPGTLSIMSYEMKLSSNPYFHYLTEGDFLQVHSKKDNTQYSIKDFFGTNDVALIRQYINVVDIQKQSTGAIQSMTENSFFDYYIQPKTLDLKCSHYKSTSELFIDLYNQNYPLLENHLSLWYEYLDFHEEDETDKNIIKNFYHIQKEKTILDSQIKSSMNIIPNKMKI
jgi:hypothetical protein